MTPAGWTPGVQVWMYPEELRFTPPEALAEQIVELGCDAVGVSLVYHRGRRVFPRHRHISILAGTGVYFAPAPGRYGELVPRATASDELRDDLKRFRVACADRDLRFRAWIVPLHDEDMVRARPDLAAQALDGSLLTHSLCPSAPAVVEYVAALARDVSEQLEPELVDLEAWQYPAWEPAYTLTLALEPLSDAAELLATQCFCASCRALLGDRADELERLARSAAGPPFGAPPGEVLPLGDAVGALAAARSSGARVLSEAVAEAVHASGALLRLLCSGRAAQTRLQGVSASSIAPADAVGLGCGRLHGRELAGRFTELRDVVAGTPLSVTASTNWTHERTAQSMAHDVAELARSGADGLSLYNLSLVPEAGLEAFATAARSFREARMAP